MSSKKKIFFDFASAIFLIAISLLIIRNNSYPWFIKRSSDILFLLSFLSFSVYILLERKTKEWFSENKRVIFALFLVVIGLAVASVTNYYITGSGIDKEGVLEFGRFIEVGMIILVTVALARADANFVKKVALAQLTTISYLAVLSFPGILNERMYRFQLFENWPSNVSYYVLVTLSLFVVSMFRSFVLDRKKLFLFYIGCLLFMSILLWTQSRAGWLTIAIVPVVVLLLWVFRPATPRVSSNGAHGGAKKIGLILCGLLLLLSLVPLAYLFLPSYVKTDVLLRIYPQYRPYVYERTSPLENGSTYLLKNVLLTNPPLHLSEPSRIFLWK